MALSQSSILAGGLKLLIGSETAMTNRFIDKNFPLAHTTEETNVDRFFVDGTVTDQAISLGKVNTPTMIFIHFESKFNGDNSTTEDAEAKVTIKVDGGTAYATNYFFAMVGDPINDAVTSTITFSTLSDTDTIVDVVVMGRPS